MGNIMLFKVIISHIEGMYLLSITVVIVPVVMDPNMWFNTLVLSPYHFTLGHTFMSSCWSCTEDQIAFQPIYQDETALHISHWYLYEHFYSSVIN